MSELLLFHHAQGLTPGVLAFADSLRTAGHTVHVPDLYHGHTFDTLDEGVAYARSVGFQQLSEDGVRAAQGLPETLVYAGFSLGVSPAQRLAQTRPGAAGALLFHACFPVSEFGPWPHGVPVQVHGMDHDPWFEEDAAAARELTDVARGDLFLYPGSRHLFADRSLADYDAGAAELLMERVLEFLNRI
jgi:dienelactone hydrolase